jgi:hypothetical protein
VNDGNAAEPSEPKRLWDEYTLIQEKIDKIGDFQFKVKGWSATLLGAVLFGGVATSKFPSALLSGIVVAIVFHLSETRQRWLGKRLGRRATAIERALRDFPPITDVAAWENIQRRHPSMRFAPAIARTMSDRSPELKSRYNPFMRGVGWLVMQSNDVFYWAQYLLLVVLLVVYFVSAHVSRHCSFGDPAISYEITAFGYEAIIKKRPH